MGKGAKRNDTCPCGSEKKYKHCCMDKKDKQPQSEPPKFDPKILISKPFIECPQCSKKEFGVLTVGRKGYTRRCRSCWYPGNFNLPPIRKKLFYLDQFVISNITKALHPDDNVRARVKGDPYWLELYKKLDVLSKYQLSICPSSLLHHYESVVSPLFEEMRIIYKHLSNGVSFYDAPTIRRFQVQKHFKNYINGNPDLPPDIKPDDIIMGNPHEWQDRIRVGVKMGVKEKDISDLRKNRSWSHDQIKKVFERWRKEDMTFDERVMEETLGYGKGIFKAFTEFYEKRDKFIKNYKDGQKIDLDSIIPPPSNLTLTTMLRMAKSKGLSDEEVRSLIEGYLTSEHLLNIPTIKIKSMLFAAIARKAKAGQKKPPNQGTFNDVDAIGSFLPYCDAMFIDNENASYLKESPLSEEINYSTKIFSNNNRDEFLDYLDSILENISEDHKNKVYEVYGKDWPTPYMSILEQQLNE